MGGTDGDLAGGTYYLAVSGYHGTFGDEGFDASSASNYSGAVHVNFDTNAVPEPATLSLVALGALALLRPRRRARPVKGVSNLLGILSR